MLKTILTLSFLLLTISISAKERAFRVERYYPTVSGYAIAWGIPGLELDFEKLDKMSIDEIEKAVDLSAVKNFVVDLETNQIIDTIENEDMVVFNIGNIHFGNHYALSLDKIVIENKPVMADTIMVTEHYKWSNHVAKILMIESSETNELKTTAIDATETFNLLQKKLRESILDKNIDLFDTGAINLNLVKTKFIPNVGDVMELSFDYSHPKSDENALEVIAQVRFKYVQGKIIPFILSVKQKQY